MQGFLPLLWGPGGGPRGAPQPVDLEVLLEEERAFAALKRDLNKFKMTLLDSSGPQQPEGVQTPQTAETEETK